MGKRRGAVKWMTVTGIFVILSAIIATARWLGNYTHSVIGAIHGKIGFLFILLIIAHIATVIKRRRR